MEYNNSSMDFKLKRIRQILWAVLAAFFFATLSSAIFRHSMVNVALCLTCMSALSVTFYFLYLRKVDFSAAYILWTTTIVCSCLIFVNYGLRDSSILVFPGILIIAAMIGSPRLLLSLFGYILFFMITLGVATICHWVTIMPPVETSIETINTIIIILSAITFTVWLLSNDLKSLLRNLEIENHRVLASKAEVAHIARHDVLTGLPNRALCEENFYQALARSMRTKEKIALVFLDVDNFKTINDSLGHSAGDKLLVELTYRIQSITRSTDRLARLGGDEFLMIIENVKDTETLSGQVQKILNVISQPLTLEHADISCSCSIGIAICPDDAKSFSQLRSKADMAMYKAKELGRNTFCFYDAGMNTDMNEYLAMVAGLRIALQDKEFQVYYQPKYDVASGNIIGAEALIRWYPQFGAPIPPNRFIPAAESTGLIVEMGEWVLHQSCVECKRWHDAGFTDFTIAVNLSVVQFRRSNIPELVTQALERTGLPASALELELTESLLVDDAAINLQLQELRAMGVSIAIDDFGTGYSNLGYLNKFSIGTLKIDQSFIRNIVQQPEDLAIVRAIIQIASSLSMKTVAEGVEDVSTLKLLQELHCDLFQGYLRAPALTASAFLDYIKKQQTTQ